MILDRILERKRFEVETARKREPMESLRARISGPRRGFEAALRSATPPAIIAEIKKASPSKGVIREHFEPALHARQYEHAGATCLSVLTDETFFQGSLSHLAAAHSACKLPLLRKDFTIDAYQIVEAKAWGADAVLLIVAALESGVLRELSSCAASEEMDVLVEVHDEYELDAAIAVGARIVGINNRDLRTFETSLDVTRRLAPRIPDGILIVAESGIRAAADIHQLRASGAHAFLVGEHLMAAENPGTALASLVRP